MPIDFAAIAATFRPPVLLQMRTITQAFQSLARWLRERLDEARGLESATRDYPIVRFYNGAVTAWISAGQHGRFGTAPPPAHWWSPLADGARGMLAGLGYVATAARQEWLLPRLADALDRVMRLVLSSMRRFIPAKPRIFDLDRKGQASDLIGGVALGARAWFRGGGSMGYVKGEYGPNPGSQVWEVLQELRRLKETAGTLQWGELLDPFKTEVMPRVALLKPGKEPPPALAKAGAAPAGGGGAVKPGDAPPSAGDGEDMAATLDGVARGIGAVILAIPMLAGLLDPLVRAGVAWAKAQVIDALAGIEAEVFGLRRWVIDLVFVDLRAFGTRAHDLVQAAASVVVDTVVFATHFAAVYLAILLVSVQAFLRNAVDFVARWVDLVNAIVDTIQSIMHYNLTPWILAPLGLPRAIVSRLPAITLDRILTVGLAAAVMALRTALQAALVGADVLKSTVPFLNLGDKLLGSPIQNRLDALWEITDELVRPRWPLPDLAAPTLAYTPLGDVFGALFGKELPGLEAALLELGVAGRDRVVNLLSAGGTLLENAAGTFESEAARAAWLGSPARLREIAGWSVGVGDAAFGAQKAELESRPADPMALGFARAVARGGFDVVGAVLPAYVARMRAWWGERAPARAAEMAAAAGPSRKSFPTSVHKLDRRFQLGRVRVPRLVVRARGRGPDPALAAAVAERFRKQVEKAYAAGLATL